MCCFLSTALMPDASTMISMPRFLRVSTNFGSSSTARARFHMPPGTDGGFDGRHANLSQRVGQPVMAEAQEMLGEDRVSHLARLTGCAGDWRRGRCGGQRPRPQRGGLEKVTSRAHVLDPFPGMLPGRRPLIDPWRTPLASSRAGPLRSYQTSADQWECLCPRARPADRSPISLDQPDRTVGGEES